MKLLGITVIALSAVCLSGCGSSIDQSSVCVYSTDHEATQCKSGQLSYFKPNRWGNEQLPLNVAAAYCDFNHQVVFNNSGVLCVFTNERVSQ